MATKNKTVSGMAQNYKLVTNGKNAPRKALGGNNPSSMMKATTSYMEAPISKASSKGSVVTTIKGPKMQRPGKSAITPAKENIKRGIR